MEPYIIDFTVGFIIGMLAGLFGVGGGFLIVPTLVLMGLPIHTAIGTSLACISISSLGSASMHMKEGRVLYRVVVLKELFSVPSAVAGAYLSGVLSERVLRTAFAGVLLYVAYKFLKHRNGEDAEDSKRIKLHNVTLVGVVAGLSSGLLGISGGILNVPLFHALAGVPIEYAVGTSSIAIFFTALAGTWGHYRLGQVDLSTALLLAPGMIVGAIIGARLITRIHPKKFKLAFSAILMILALKLLL